MDRPDREKIAEQLYLWHCESQGISKEPFKEQNEIVRNYWIAKADQILALIPATIVPGD